MVFFMFHDQLIAIDCLSDDYKYIYSVLKNHQTKDLILLIPCLIFVFEGVLLAMRFMVITITLY